MSKFEKFPRLIELRNSINNLNDELIVSDFLMQQYNNHPDWFKSLDLTSSLRSLIECSISISALKTSLRNYRNYVITELILEEFQSSDNTISVMVACSALADDCIQLAVNWLELDLTKKLGSPKNCNGELQKLVVLGMGKLGGKELNLSSDIDLIFTFPEAGFTEGARRSVDNEVFFNRLVQQLIGVLTEFTSDGFVFRVDSRLRPFGESGPLVSSFESISYYYLEQGRGWERFAMIKARAITGISDQKTKIIEILKPFVYRRYIDFSMLETPRKIKQQIEAELRRRKLGENIKLGPGGIREIEFIVQAMQLVHGGKLRSLQQTSTLAGLYEIEKHQLLSEVECNNLRTSYLKLRHWEHCLQGFNDQQTQTLPNDELNQQRLCYLSDVDDWKRWLVMLDSVRAPVHRIFLNQFADKNREQRLTISDELLDLWLAPEKNKTNNQLLASLGYVDADTVLESLISFKERLQRRTQRISSRAEAMITKLVPEVIRLSGNVEAQVDSLERMLLLLESVLTRTVYLDLFVENKNTLRLLTELFSKSPWIAQHTKQYPLVLDDLLNPSWLEGEYIDDNGAVLIQQLARIPEDDEEQLLDLFREFKQSAYFQLAACFSTECLSIKQIAQYLSNIANTLVNQAYLFSRKKVEKRYGQLLNSDSNNAEFIVIAMGKLGSGEMGFSSDLDLVFIHDGCECLTNGKREIDGFQFFAKLAQKLIHALSIRMSSGVLYEIDTRLRPSGNSGYLVSSIEEYEQYQLEQAWTWEHQALVRAKAIAGSDKLRTKFNQVREDILNIERDKLKLVNDVSKMRIKMKKNAMTTVQGWDPKQGDGGLTDIEFLVQYLVLANAYKISSLSKHTSMLKLLKVLAEEDLLMSDESKRLQKNYLSYLEYLNQQTMMGLSTIAGVKFKVERQEVIDILEKYKLYPWK